MKSLKLLLSSLLVLSLVIGCKTGNNGNLQIKATIPSAADQMAYLLLTDSAGQRRIDSARISEKGILKLSAHIPRLDFYQIELGEGSAPFIFVAEPGDSLRVIFDQFPGDIASVHANQKTEDFYDYNRALQRLSRKRDSLMQAYRANPQNKEAMLALQNWRRETQDMALTFITNHPGAPASMSALQVVNPMENLSLYQETYDALAEKMKGSVYLKNLNNMIAEAKVRKAQMDARKKEQQKQEELLTTGKKAPEIALPNPNGQVKKLSDLRGKVVLIDFWASWCKPCRKENPNVVRLYNKYKDKGFEIYGVSLDRNKKAWTNAIQQDNLSWIHVSDLKLWSSAAAQLYRVRSIPFTVLIDRDGKIIAKNLRGPSLESKLEEIFS